MRLLRRIFIAAAGAIVALGCTAHADGVLLRRQDSAPTRHAHADPAPTPLVSLASGGTHGFPFPNTLLDLGRFGYVQEEVFIEGTARSYVPVAPLDTIADGRWDATASGPTAPYKTRLLIRRPANPAKFNGTVVVEWLNVSAGYDSDTFDGFGEQFMRDGYVHVGVSAQAGGVNFLRNTWETGAGARYTSLSHPGDSYSYDIFSQAAKAILYGEPAPLGHLTRRVTALIAWGGSQSGARLFTYYNAVHPNVRLFDGVIPFITNSGAPLSQAPLAVVTVPTGAQSIIRTDIRTPVLYQNSESEFLGGARGIHSQPDSKYFRLWEYTGTSHANRVGIDYTIQRLQANGVQTGVFPECGNPPINDLPVFAVWRAMINAMDRWVNENNAPTRAPRVEISIPSDPTQPATLVRDSISGIANGGIKLPEVAVPTRSLTGPRPPGANPVCFLFGASDPWNGDSDAWDGDPLFDLPPSPEPTLAGLYGTKQRYIKAVKQTAADLVDKGFLLPRDAKDSIERAKALPFTD